MGQAREQLVVEVLVAQAVYRQAHIPEAEAWWGRLRWLPEVDVRLPIVALGSVSVSVSMLVVRQPARSLLAEAYSGLRE
jgi:hypothetical protein